jgi:hypothetical protein
VEGIRWSWRAFAARVEREREDENAGIAPQ